MQYDVSFGRLDQRARAAHGPAFRLAVLGDFSGRANAGTIETGAALARRKPLKADVDTLDGLLARLAPRIAVPLGDADSAVSIPIASLDDFHPDQLAELPVFEELITLRRNLMSRAGFDRAAREVLSWAGEAPLPPPPRRARGSAIATDRKLSDFARPDFARLTGRPAAAEASADDLIRRIVGPFIVPERDGRQDALVARVDAALSDTMRRVLHHPDFQAAEALWRSVEFLVRRIETGARLQIVLYDISAEELAADLAASDALDQSALFSLLVEQPALDAQQGPISMIAGLYQFEATPPHADLLGRIAQVAAAAGAPFVAGIAPDALRTPQHDWNPLIQQAWGALRALPASAYLGLAAPRFLLRMPYGKKTDPIDAFAFEEFSRQSGLSGMLWGNPAVLAALLAAQTWSRSGKAMTLGSAAVVGDLPVYVYHDTDGEQIALPCTERLFTEREAGQIMGCGVMPAISLRGRPELRLGGFGSLAGPPLAGRWAPVDTSPPKPPPAAVPVPAPAPKPAVPAQAPAAAAAPMVKAAPPPAAAPPAIPAASRLPPAPVSPMPADRPVSPMPAPASAPVSEPGSDELDALLANLATPAPPPAPAAAPAPPPAAAVDDLDALLASLNVEPPPTAPDAVDADLDALLASLK